MIFMERPLGMTLEARQEALDYANRRYAAASIDRIYDDEARSKMPNGIEPWLQQIRQDRGSPERAPDSWKPKHRAPSGGMPMDD